jgi:DnaJ-class molecular chaperone
VIYPHCASADQPTEKEREHQIHKVEGTYYSWCEICVDEEICPDCKGTGSINGKFCDNCESSGRRI